MIDRKLAMELAGRLYDIGILTVVVKEGQNIQRELTRLERLREEHPTSVLVYAESLLEIWLLRGYEIARCMTDLDNFKEQFIGSEPQESVLAQAELFFAPLAKNLQNSRAIAAKAAQDIREYIKTFPQ